MPLTRTRVRRVAGELLTGAVLGGLAFVAARELGLPVIFGWIGYEPFVPVVIVAALLFATPLRALVWGAGAALLVVLAVAALTPAIVRPAQAMIRADAAERPFDAVAILSSALNDDRLISADALDRIVSGLALARSRATEAHPAGVPVVLTVVTRGRGRTTASSTGDQQRLVDLAGGGVEVHWTTPVHSTRDEARAVAALARSEGWERVAVVTSPLHTRRACATFEKAGVSVRCVPADSRDFAARALRSSRDRIRATQLWLYEVAGTVYYKLRGWM